MTRPRDALLAAALMGATSTLGACVAPGTKAGTSAISHSSTLACAAAHNDLARAIEAYTMLEGSPPKRQADLVPKYLYALSPLMDIDAKGNIVPAPGSRC